MMLQKINRIIGLVLLGMLCCIGSMNAMPQASQPAAWRTTPTMSTSSAPSYQFRSTSSYTPIVGTTSYTSEIYAPGTSSPMRGPRRSESDPWTVPENDDDGVGNVYTPLGEPLILLLFALCYIAYRRLTKKYSL